MKKLFLILILGLLLSNTSFAKRDITKSDFYNRIEEKGNMGFVLRYHNEKSPSGYEIVMPKNAPPIISDFKSKYGVLGGSRSDYGGTKFSAKHGGIDFYIKVGSPILAAADGKVYGVKVKDQCVGNQFAIDFGKGPDGKRIRVAYMHVGKIHVKKGDQVKRGQLIADAGALVKTNCGGGMEHLHFHMSKNKGSGGWGSYRFLGGPKGWLNPHEYWTGGKGKPECYVEGKEYTERLLTLPFACD